MGAGLEIAIIGPDNVGKGKVAERIHLDYDTELIEPTHFRHSSSPAIRALGSLCRAVTEFGDRRNSRAIAAFGYLGDLVLFSLARRMNERDVVYVRYPPIDFQVYKDEYTGAVGPLKGAAEFFLSKIAGSRDHMRAHELDTVIYLYADPVTIIERSRQGSRQIHETQDALERIVARYDCAVGALRQSGVQVLPIDTTRMALDEVVELAACVISDKLAPYKRERILVISERADSTLPENGAQVLTVDMAQIPSKEIAKDEFVELDVGILMNKLKDFASSLVSNPFEKENLLAIAEELYKRSMIQRMAGIAGAAKRTHDIVFGREKLLAIAEDLHRKGIIRSDAGSLEERLGRTTYIADNLVAHVAIALSTLPGVVPGVTDIASSIGKESWSISMLMYELANRNYGRAAVHASVIPFCWFPRVGGLSYLLPMEAIDPEAALVHAYALSRFSTGVITTVATTVLPINRRTIRKNPEELCEWIGSFPMFRLAARAYDASMAHYAFDAAGAALKYAVGYPVNFARERTTAPLHSLLERYPAYAALDRLFQNVVYAQQLVFGKVVAPGFMRGARS